MTDSPPGFVRCAHCGAFVDEGLAHCGACGEAIDAAMKKCPHCYGSIDARASACPHCGKNVKVKTAGYQIGSFLGALGLLVAIGGVLGLGATFIVLGLLLLLVGLAVRQNA